MKKKRKNFHRELLKKETLYDKLFKVVDDYEIYSRLIGFELELGEAISSPIRGRDDNPSFALFIPTRVDNVRPDAIWFKDLADGRFGDVIRFVKYFALHQFDLDLNNSFEIVKFLDEQLKLGMFDNSGPQRKAIIRNFERKNHDIYFKTRDFTKKDLEYWNNLGIEKSTLEHFNVKSVRYLLKDNGEVRREFRKTELAFIYLIHDKVKLYQPYAPKAFKFRNSCPGNDPRYYQGFEQLEGHDTLIITKSLKDVMLFWQQFKNMETPVDVIAPHAESINLSEKFITAVKKQYSRIIVVSDFDLAGVKFANKCKREGFEIKFIDTTRTLINDKYKVIDKDISDYAENNGLFKTKKLLRKWNVE